MLTANGQPLDIILVTIDALRADHLGVYGYDRPTSPNLDAFAATSVVVRDHIAQAPYTKASIASLFTGLFPTSHKTYTMSRAVQETMAGHVEGVLPVTDVVDPQLWTLARALSAAGYETVALNTNPFLLKEFGFASGFDDYRFMSAGETLAAASDVVASALERIDRRTPGKPLFLWLHVMEPHTPYSAPAAVQKLFPPGRPARMVPADALPVWFGADASRDARVYAVFGTTLRSATSTTPWDACSRV